MLGRGVRRNYQDIWLSLAKTFVSAFPNRLSLSKTLGRACPFILRLQFLAWCQYISPET